MAIRCRYKNDKGECIAGCPMLVGPECDDIPIQTRETCARRLKQLDIESAAARAGLAYNFITNQWEQIRVAREAKK